MLSLFTRQRTHVAAQRTIRSEFSPPAAGLSALLLRSRFDRIVSGHYTHRFLFRGLTQNEAHLSAKQSPPETDARLPGPDAEERRSGGALPPSSQGSQTTRSLMARARAVESVQARPEGLPRERRLAKRREFLRVYETGRKLFSRYCVVFFAVNALPYSRIGITTTKKIGKANVRNRLKRWTREVYRRERLPLGLDQNSLDFVVNVKPNAAEATFLDYSSDLQRILQRVATERSR